MVITDTSCRKCWAREVLIRKHVGGAHGKIEPCLFLLITLSLSLPLSLLFLSYPTNPPWFKSSLTTSLALGHLGISKTKQSFLLHDYLESNLMIDHLPIDPISPSNLVLSPLFFLPSFLFQVKPNTLHYS